MTKDKTATYFATPDDAESAFYSAFEMGDISLMDAVIADENVSCIHPNGMPILGREAVMQGWMQILVSLDEPAFYLDVLERSINGDVAIHIVAERIAADHQLGTETSLVIATNVYVKQSNGWRMMMHHSSLPPYEEEENRLENDPSITHKAPRTMQ